MRKTILPILCLLLTVLFAPFTLAAAPSVDLSVFVATQTAEACTACHVAPEYMRQERQQSQTETPEYRPKASARTDMTERPLWGIKPNRHAMVVNWSPD